VALQEIGPRFTLKLKWLKKGIPAVYNYGESPQPLEFKNPPGFEDLQKESSETAQPQSAEEFSRKTIPPKQNEFIWQWKVSF